MFEGAKKKTVIMATALVTLFCSSALKADQQAYLLTALPENDIYSVYLESDRQNKTELLVDADEIVPEIYRLIESAEKKIQISVFLFGGETGREIAKRVIEKHKQGVEVEFVADPTMGDLSMMVAAAEKEYEFLRSNGIDVRIFPVDLLPKGSFFLSNLRYINHNKMFIVDDRSAILGGMNVLDSEIINHDYMIKISGPAVKVFSKIASDVWKESDRIRNFRVNYESEFIDRTPVKLDNLEIAQTGFYEQSIGNMVLDYINKAKSSILVEVLLLDHAGTIEALIAAKERGVDVKVILEKVSYNKYYNFNTPFPGIVNFNAVSQLSRAGIPVRWYKPENEKVVMHGKIALIDDETLIVGSANFTYPAFYRNHEIAVAVKDKNVTAKFKDVFTKDWEQRTEKPDIGYIEAAIGKTMVGFQETIYTEWEQVN